MENFIISLEKVTSCVTIALVILVILSIILSAIIRHTNLNKIKTRILIIVGVAIIAAIVIGFMYLFTRYYINR